jgi:hypothetical protein
MRKEMVVNIKPANLAALAALCAVLALMASGCTRTATRVEKLGTSAADTEVGARKTNNASAVRVSAEKTEAAEPAVAPARDNTVYVAWVEHRGKEADVWLAHFDGEEMPLGQPVRVNPNAGEATAWRGDPPTVAVAPDSTVYVGWTARDENAPQASTLYVSASRDGGRSFGEPAKVNDDSAQGVHGMHSLAVGDDGRVYVAWLDERDIPEAHDGGEHANGKTPAKMPMQHGEHNREVFFSYSNDGGRTFSANKRVAVEACPCCKTSLAVSRGGRVYVGWRQVLPGDFRHIAVASSNDGGDTFDAPVVVSDDRWELRGCPVSGPALAAGDGERLTVLWFTAGDAGTAGLYSSESSDGGRTFAPRRVVTESGVRGTPQLLPYSQGAAVAVFEGDGENNSPGLLKASFDGAEHSITSNNRTQFGAGELPASTILDGRIYTAYISNGGVWLTSVK